MQNSSCRAAITKKVEKAKNGAPFTCVPVTSVPGVCVPGAYVPGVTAILKIGAMPYSPIKNPWETHPWVFKLIACAFNLRAGGDG